MHTHARIQEVNSRYADRHKILRFTSKRVTRKYSFEKGWVPQECEYLMVRYSTDYPAPQPGDSGHTFSHVFGTNTSRSGGLATPTFVG